MCTVSILRPWPVGAGGVGVRLVSNRDERPAREPARPPGVVDAGPVRVVRPIDPAGGGTWIAANDAGFVFTLLNGLEPEGERTSTVEPPSRGGIVMAIASARSIEEIEGRLRALDWAAYRPWRLVVAGAGRLLQVESAARSRRLVVRSLPDRLMVTASSRLELEARRRRERLFRKIVPRPDIARQDAFHGHTWPDRPEISVEMRRPEARTVSRTSVAITSTSVRMVYAAVPAIDTPVEVILYRSPAEVI